MGKYAKENRFWSSDTRQTDCRVGFGQVTNFWSSDTRQTDRQKAMHKSPPCIGTGVLKNYLGNK